MAAKIFPNSDEAIYEEISKEIYSKGGSEVQNRPMNLTIGLQKQRHGVI